MSDLYKNNTMLRQWGINSTGYPECINDAVLIELISQEDKEAIEVKNTAIHEAINNVIALENAYLVQEPETTRTYEVEDAPVWNEETQEYDEQSHTEDRPEWTAWDLAQALILEASSEVKALAALRAGSANEEDIELVNTTWNYDIPITIKEYLPDLEPAQFWGVVFATGNNTDIDNYINQVAITDPMIAGLIRGRVIYSKAYRRYDPLTETMRQWNEMTEAEFNALWNWAAAS